VPELGVGALGCATGAGGAGDVAAGDVAAGDSTAAGGEGEGSTAVSRHEGGADASPPLERVAITTITTSAVSASAAAAMIARRDRSRSMKPRCRRMTIAAASAASFGDDAAGVAAAGRLELGVETTAITRAIGETSSSFGPTTYDRALASAMGQAPGSPRRRGTLDENQIRTWCF
jgi:hypothetical protein